MCEAGKKGVDKEGGKRGTEVTEGKTGYGRKSWEASNS
jgi:hypothetical protein